ncbi:hypothetical protein CEXT_11361 [Caerostris extrusa]|uniref:Uncharacterized protein n=1 Tax=Caerostris extrusa TaxID=172846 RepID=A0AAV4V761_CAEEX|nr:hypothetical protein CEXT_11361 [Caerostris extrusa]
MRIWSNRRFKGMVKNKGGSAGILKYHHASQTVIRYSLAGKIEPALTFQPPHDGSKNYNVERWETNSITGKDGRRQDTPSSAAARKQTSQQKGKSKQNENACRVGRAAFLRSASATLY